jgi:hypothetical protein
VGDSIEADGRYGLDAGLGVDEEPAGKRDLGLDRHRGRASRALVVEQPRQHVEQHAAPRRPGPWVTHGRVRVRLARLQHVHREVGVDIDDRADCLLGGLPRAAEGGRKD